MKLGHITLIILGLALLTSCGGGGSGDGAENAIARVEISPSTVLLTQLNDSYLLTARAFNVSGEEVDASFVWQSSDESLISVNQSGEITNLDTVGSTLITVQADGVSSEPATVIAVEPAINSRFVSDQQVLSEPQLIDPGLPVDIGTRYSIIISDAVDVAVGDILLGSETAPVGGRVVAITSTASGKQVTLELISINEMFTRLKINQTYQLSTDDVELSETLDGIYNMVRNADGSIDFAPQARPAGTQFRTPTGTFANPFHPLECNSTLPTIPLTLDALPLSEGLTFDLNLIINYDSDNAGLQKLALAGSVQVVIKVTPTLTAAFEGKITCKLELVTFTVPVGGPLALVLGAQVPLGVGFEAGGKITVAQVGVDISSQASFNAEVGVQKNADQASWETIATASSDAKADYKIIMPDANNLDAQFRIEPSLKGFTYADLTVGNRFFRALQFNAFTVSAGAVESANLSTVGAQLVDLVDDYKSDYKFSLAISAGLGSQSDPLFRLLNINPAAVALGTELVLATSPQLESASADVASFGIGEAVIFTVKLKSNTLDYISLTSSEPYNIDRIIIYRRIDNGSGNITHEQVASEDATIGQSEFTLDWVADHDGTITNNFFVFVDTTALSIPFTAGLLGIPLLDELELGKVTQPPSSNKIIFVSNRGGNVADIYRMNQDGSAIINLSQHDKVELDPEWSRDGSKIAFSSFTNGIADRGIYVMNADGSNRSSLTPGSSSASSPSWSADGSKIAYVDFPGAGSGEIFVMDANGSNQINLTQSSEGEIDVAWSPDGLKLAYVAFFETNDEIFVMNADGSGKIRLTNNSSIDSDPAWSPDSNKIAFSRGGDIHVVNADGSNSVNITNGNEATPAFEPAWSPDGSNITVTRRLNNIRNIFIMNADGSSPVNITPDNNFDYYQSNWLP